MHRALQALSGTVCEEVWMDLKLYTGPVYPAHLVLTDRDVPVGFYNSYLYLGVFSRLGS